MAEYVYTDDENELWRALESHAGETFVTFSGLEFTYRIVGGEMFISRKEKSVTRSTVNASYRKAKEVMARDGFVAGPKKLGTFGASYIYPIFMKLGIIRTETESLFSLASDSDTSESL